MDDWAGVATAVAAIGTFVVAVVALSSSLVSRAINKQGELLEKHEKKNAEEHAGLGKRIDQVDTKIDKVSETLNDVHRLVIRLDERQQAAEKRERDE